MNVLVILSALICLIFMWRGGHRGLFRGLFGFLAMLVAAVGTVALAPRTDAFLTKNTQLEEKIQSSVSAKIRKRADDLYGPLYATAGDAEPEDETEGSVLQALQIPAFMENSLLQDAAASFHFQQGISNFCDYAAFSIARQIMTAVSKVVTFLLLQIALGLIGMALAAAIRHSAVLSFANRMGGAAFGLLAGMIAVWLLLFICRYALGDTYTSMISGNALLQKLDETDIFMKNFLK